MMGCHLDGSLPDWEAKSSGREAFPESGCDVPRGPRFLQFFSGISGVSATMA
jgi:hypothetical protein